MRHRGPLTGRMRLPRKTREQIPLRLSRHLREAHPHVRVPAATYVFQPMRIPVQHRESPAHAGIWACSRSSASCGSGASSLPGSREPALSPAALPVYGKPETLSLQRLCDESVFVVQRKAAKARSRREVVSHLRASEFFRKRIVRCFAIFLICYTDDAGLWSKRGFGIIVLRECVSA